METEMGDKDKTEGELLEGAKTQRRRPATVEQVESKRNLVEQALRESEERYRQVVKHAPTGIYELDMEANRITSVNDVMCEYTGYTREELLSMSPDRLLTDEGKELFAERRKRLLSGNRIPENVEYKITCKDGREIWAILNVRSIYEGEKPTRVTVVAHDITERKQAEEALRESERKLRLLSSYLLTAQETERGRISKELHDELGQGLIALKLRLRSIERKLGKDQTALREECEETQEYIDQVIENVRRLSRDLSPYILEDLGLSAGLRRVIDGFIRHHGLKASVSIADIDGLFSQRVQLMIYRIIQEVLTNIGKHAEATRISVVVKEEDRRVAFLVGDDGKGFELKQAMRRHSTEEGIGLSTMDERVRILGGSISIWSQKGKGTRIGFTIPIEEKN